MKVNYRPGTPDGKVGSTFRVEVVKIVTMENPHIKMPMLKEVQIKYKDGKREWISGEKFLNGIDMVQPAVSKQII